jgi:gliding motility-associated lipoprotein GldH
MPVMQGKSFHHYVLTRDLQPVTLAYIFLLVVCCCSCEKNRTYEKNVSIEKYSWDSKVAPAFTVDIRDTSQLYNIYVNVRHNDEYPFQNLWLLVTTQFPDSTASRRIEINLADDEGKWYGEGIGDIWDYRSQIQENALFDRPGKYTFTLAQNMRQDPIPGIMAVGIRLENTGMKKNAPASPKREN